jgi:uncharacterized membrane protein (UPF0127 family)
MSYKYFLPIGFFIFSFAILLAMKDPTRSETLSCPDFNQTTLTINQYSFNIALAITPAQQIQGLSGCKNIPENSGLLFPFSEKKIASFWMKEMFVPIDIIWISDGKVVGIEHNVKEPSNFKETNLPTYSPAQPINAVLELPAGTSHKLNITTGDTLQ